MLSKDKLRYQYLLMGLSNEIEAGYLHGMILYATASMTGANI